MIDDIFEFVDSQKANVEIVDMIFRVSMPVHGIIDVLNLTPRIALFQEVMLGCLFPPAFRKW